MGCRIQGTNRKGRNHMKLRIQVKINANTYRTITQKQAMQIMGDVNFNKAKADFIDLVNNANDMSYLDYYAVSNGCQFYFDKI